MDSLVPLLYVRCGSLEAAMENATAVLENSIATFESSSRQLLERYAAEPELHNNLEKFVHGCKCACTANLNWRSVAPARWHLQALFADSHRIVWVQDGTSSEVSHWMVAWWLRFDSVLFKDVVYRQPGYVFCGDISCNSQ